MERFWVILGGILQAIVVGLLLKYWEGVMQALSNFWANITPAWIVLICFLGGAICFVIQYVRDKYVSAAGKLDRKVSELDTRLALFGRQKNVILDAINRLANKIPDGPVITEQLKTDLADLEKEGVK